MKATTFEIKPSIFEEFLYTQSLTKIGKRLYSTGKVSPLSIY